MAGKEYLMWTERMRRLRTAWGDALADERGDVPGWVLMSNLRFGVCNV